MGGPLEGREGGQVRDNCKLDLLTVHSDVA